jgi:HemY protein
MEGALAIARAALDARELTTARAALEPLAGEPTQRVAMLMAQLEGLEGDEGRAREWMARALTAARDPAWTADGFVSERWLPLSPVSGRLDAFQWKVPVADIGERAPVMIEGPVAETVPPPEAVPQVLSPPLGNVTPETGAAISRPPAVAPAPITRPPPRVAPIIPLTQVPDDPGPEPDDGRSDGAQGSSWQRIRQIFR